MFSPSVAVSHVDEDLAMAGRDLDGKTKGGTSVAASSLSRYSSS